MMEKLALKAKILLDCKTQQLAKAANLRAVMDEAQKSANEYGIPRDRYDSYRAQVLRKADMFAQQLEKANQQFDLLNQIPVDKIMENVEFGAVVITDKQKMFVSISLGKVVVDKEVYYAISPAVPIYKAIEGKKVGEAYTFNGVTFTIKDVF